MHPQSIESHQGHEPTSAPILSHQGLSFLSSYFGCGGLVCEEVLLFVHSQKAGTWDESIECNGARDI
jgi:hypothetical protein